MILLYYELLIFAHLFVATATRQSQIEIFFCGCKVCIYEWCIMYSYSVRFTKLLLNFLQTTFQFVTTWTLYQKAFFPWDFLFFCGSFSSNLSPETISRSVSQKLCSFQDVFKDFSGLPPLGRFLSFFLGSLCITDFWWWSSFRRSYS